MIKRILLLPALFFIMISGFAQQAKVVADKIAGILGDKIILRSELTTAVADIQRNGGATTDECTVLDNMLIQKALVLQSERDSLPVSDEEVDAELDQKIRYFINLYNGKDALEQIAQRTVYQLKQDMRPNIREQRQAQAMRNKIVEEDRKSVV